MELLLTLEKHYIFLKGLDSPFESYTWIKNKTAISTCQKDFITDTGKHFKYIFSFNF